MAHPKGCREATRADAPSLSLLLTQMGHVVGPEDVADRIGYILEMEDQTVLVAETAGTLVGSVHLRREVTLAKGNRVRLVNFVVDSSARRKDVGKTLLAGASVWARGWGSDNLYLVSPENRPDARMFYSALGFKQAAPRVVFEFPVDLAG